MTSFQQENRAMLKMLSEIVESQPDTILLSVTYEKNGRVQVISPIDADGTTAILELGRITLEKPSKHYRHGVEGNLDQLEPSANASGE